MSAQPNMLDSSLETKADLDARVEWPAIEARNKIAFFAADVSRTAAGAPLLTYTVCIPGEHMSREASEVIQQKMSELAAAIRDGLQPCVAAPASTPP